ncbi:7638_t:CDS:2 [Dentiscutata erythropus]|uniref:7638_t:CDS:1 n=1 Tax=Dentiscutata erythropus TaxID=1348616 RepID=A0A9N8VM36_9GLOM|nr:7638_t:CDS:2 [Dentiscutata erythropus]
MVASIHAALKFLEAQKTSSTLSLTPLLSTKKKLEVSFKLQHEYNTRSLKIIQLEKENQQLKEYIQVLEYPGTTSLSSIIKYPSMKASSSEEKSKTRSKAFKFRNLVTSEAITKEL